MELLATDEQGVQTLRLIGSFEPSDVLRFERAIDRSVEGGCVRVVVDASLVKIVSSTALSAFLRAQARLARQGGDLVFGALPHFAVEVFETLGLDRRIRCFETVEEGVRFVADPAS